MNRGSGPGPDRGDEAVASRWRPANVGSLLGLAVLCIAAQYRRSDSSAGSACSVSLPVTAIASAYAARRFLTHGVIAAAALIRALRPRSTLGPKRIRRPRLRRARRFWAVIRLARALLRQWTALGVRVVPALPVGGCGRSRAGARGGPDPSSWGQVAIAVMKRASGQVGLVQTGRRADRLR